MRQSKKSLLLKFLLAFGIGVMLAPASAQDRGPGGREPPPKGAQPQAQRRGERKIPQRQAEALEQAKREGVGVVWGERMQSPRSVRGRDLGEPRAFSAAGRRLQVRKDAGWQENAVAVMDNLAPLFGVGDAQEEFAVKKVDADKLGFHHVRMTQRYRGLNVFGSELIVHFDADGQAYEVNGEYAPGIDIDIRPGVAAEAAEQVARADQAAMGVAAVEAAKAPELCIYAFGGCEPRLAWELAVAYAKGADGKPGYWRYWVDAQTGGILQKYNDVKLIAAPTPTNGVPAVITGRRLIGEGGDTVQVEGWLQNGAYYLYNTNFTWMIYNYSTRNAAYYDANTYAHRMSDDWGSSDPAEISAAYNINEILRYYREVHGRHSYNNSNALVRVNVNDESVPFNASWRGGINQIFIGDGFSYEEYNFAVLDVVAHEFTHAVTDFTADLVYLNESGALNESFSDIFGACVEFFAQADNRGAYPSTSPGTADWIMGEDCGAIRDMRTPSEYGQPSRHQGTDWHTGGDDNGGVHDNSGPHNFFFYLLCEGGVGNNDGLPYNVEGIGITRAEQIAYRVLTVYCTANTDYEGVRLAWLSAAYDLYPECTRSVARAWAAVMYPPPPPHVIVTDEELPDGRVGNLYVTTFWATGPLAALDQWSVVDGALPAGITLLQNGKLTGAPMAAGTYVFTVAVETVYEQVTTNMFWVTIRPPLEAPFEEGFEGEMEGPLTGWMQEADNNHLWSVRQGSASSHPSIAREGQLNAYLGAWVNGTLVRPAHTTRLISPMIVFGPSPRAAQLSFSMTLESRQGQGIQQDALRVYCKENWDDPWGEPLAVYAATTVGWFRRTVDLPLASPPRPFQQFYIAFEGEANQGYGVCVDAIQVGDPTPALAILTPSQLPAATVGTNYTELVRLESEGGWSDDPGEYTYAVIDGAFPAGFALTPEGVVTGCSHQVETCLLVVQVTDSMGYTATKVMAFAVEQPRAPVHEEGFDSSANFPAGWTQVHEAGSLKWQVVSSRNPPYPPTSAHSGSRFALYHGAASQGSEIRTKLVSPVLDLSQLPANTRLTFWHFMQKWSGQDELRIYYRNAPANAWTRLESYTNNVQEWTQRVVQLPDLSATYQVAFEGRARSGYGVGVDAVQITSDAAAPIILTLPALPGGFTGFAYHTALEAVGGAPGYTWALAEGALPAGLALDPSDGTISGVPTGDGTSSFKVSVTGSDGLTSTNSFAIRILPPGQMPFMELFNEPGLPEGWSLEKVLGNASWVFCSGTVCPYPNKTPANAPPGTASNACFWTQSSGEVISRLVTPPINLAQATNAVLMFQLCMPSYLGGNEQLRVRYRTNALDNWVTLTNYTRAVSSWTPQVLQLPDPSATYYIAFEGRSVGVAKGYGVCVGSVYVMGGSAGSGFDAWREEHFEGSDLSDPNVSGPNADPDGDGIPNLLEYAMGLDPNAPDTDRYIYGGLTNVVSTAGVPDGNYLYLKYRRKNAVTDVTFKVLGTPSLSPPALNWQELNIRELAPWMPGDQPDVWSWVHNIHLTPSTNAPQRFLRLRVELQ